ncbi:hypothetical protein GN316_18950 [Xylophilus sp. Kf1]|nr:hypothetical protein [Xylophilus sp. Kf1]
MNAGTGRIFFSAVLAVVATLGSQASQAHHGWGDYDDKQPLTLKARVVELNYANPHASVVIDVGGKRWNAILAPISRMEARGASRQALEPNQEITVVGYPSRTQSGEMRVERVILGDKTVELR